ncbi:hypothetical protein RISK_004978 [Rhodopirellula islandica]|uniref:Uncharacterized protein n=1 Tax=Rhodopirellula islandica TaxID=595434 RepID=A0A0J1B905_RHOIS|nr:hypothetical protein RISK_004978 [Rhodopirellula islandica]
MYAATDLGLKPKADNFRRSATGGVPPQDDCLVDTSSA